MDGWIVILFAYTDSPVLDFVTYLGSQQQVGSLPHRHVASCMFHAIFIAFEAGWSRNRFRFPGMRLVLCHVMNG